MRCANVSREPAPRATGPAACTSTQTRAASGKALLLPALDAALATEEALKELVRTAPHRLDYGPPTTRELRDAVAKAGPAATEEHLSHRKRPASRRGGINLRPLFDTGSVEFRLPNGSLDPDAIYRTIELWLRWMAAVGRGEELPGSPGELARALGAPLQGYPEPREAPDWWWRRRALDHALYPVLLPHCRQWFRELYPSVQAEADVVWIDGGRKGSIVALTEADEARAFLLFRWHAGAWTRVEAARSWRPDLLAASEA